MGSIKSKKTKKAQREKVKKHRLKEVDPLSGVSSIGFDLNYTSGYLLSFNNSDD